MAEQEKTEQTEGIDYSGKQAAITKAKEKAHDDDLERLKKEHEPA